MSHSSPNLIDVTIKEGGLRIQNCWLLDQVDDIVHEVGSAGITHIEISHGMGIGANEAGFSGLHTDRELLEAAKRRTSSIKLIAHISPEYSFSELEPLAPYFDIGRIGLNVDEPDKAKRYIDKLAKLGKKVIVQLLRVQSRPVEDCIQTAKKLADWGAEVIYITDSFGSLTPDEIKTYIGNLKNSLQRPLGFQGRNNTGQAIPNALAAWDEGAQWLDGAILGMGPGSGVASLEKLVTCFQSMGHCNDIRLGNLCNAGKFFVKPALHSLPQINYLDLILARHRLDYYPQDLLPHLSDILDINLEDFLKALKEFRKDKVSLTENDLRSYLNTHQLDLDVVMEFLKTGKVP